MFVKGGLYLLLNHRNRQGGLVDTTTTSLFSFITSHLSGLGLNSQLNLKCESFITSHLSGPGFNSWLKF